MKQLEDLIVAVSMYSRIPAPRLAWTKENMRFALCWFPLVGGVLGLLAALWQRAAAFLCTGEMLRAVVFTLIPLVVTGGIHMDGFLDTMDALASWGTPKRRLEILKDPHIGAFGVMACGMYLLLYTAVFGEIRQTAAIDTLAVGFLYSRALSGFAVARFPCAKKDGLAATFASLSDRRRVGWILGAQAVLYAALMIWIRPVFGAAATAAGILVFLYYRWKSVRAFGGITGDLAGYFLQLCELFMAVAVAVAQRIG